MAVYLAPGVYVEEVSGGPRPIEAVGTNIAAFVGLTERGPTRPRLVTNWGDFTRWFGDTIDTTVSYHAVRGPRLFRERRRCGIHRAGRQRR